MGNNSKQAASGMVLAAASAIAILASGRALADAPSYPSAPAVAGNGYAAGAVIDTPPEFTLCLYGIVILTFACLGLLLWLMLRARPERKPGDEAEPELRPLAEGGAARHLLAWLGGLIGYPGPM